LEAYERLKGTGQITEIEGKKATQAITRMQRSVSESEFMQAATEFRSALQTALDRTNTRLSTARTRTQPPAPVGAGARPSAPPAAAGADAQAREWLRQNPNHPRAAEVRGALGE
jgi:hypothetical protein